MREINTNPPAGTRDFLPATVKFREKIFATIKRVFESFGFLPLETPAFERIDVLTGKYGEEGEKLIYKILKRGEQAATGEADLALRYDLTIPMSRTIARYKGELPSIFKRYQMQPVWRAERPGRGRFREFYQCDVDTSGTTSLLADAEILLALSEAIGAVGLRKFVIRLNSRKVLKGLLNAYKVPEALERSILTALDKLDKVGSEGVVKELRERGLSGEAVNRIVADMNESGDVSIRKRLKDSRVGQEGLSEVDGVIRLTAPLLKEGKIEFSPFLARGLDYYTGPIFEIFADGLAGSIASGGRYDDLIGMFAGKSIPACGGSLGIERIAMILEEQNPNKEVAPPVQVMVVVWDETFAEDALQFSEEARRAGISAEVYLGGGNIGRQISSASKRGIPYCIVYGPDEKKRKEVILKDLRTGEQKSILRSDVARSLLDEISKSKDI